MILLEQYTKQKPLEDDQKKEICQFLFTNLEQYVDPEHEIADAIDYAMGVNGKPGGLIVTATDETSRALLGAVVVNKTGMSGYIPENILVYIATDSNRRGLGIGKKLMQATIENSTGDIALHCEPENPAIHLYNKLGFTSKYLEMRLKK